MTKISGRLKGIVFDLDGTLIDTVWAHAASWVKAFEKNGFSAKVDEVEPLIGMGGKRIVEVLMGEDGLRLFPAIYKYKNAVYIGLIKEVKLFPRVIETLHELRENGLKLALATSTISNVLSKMFERFLIRELFDTIVTGDETISGKPEPEIFLKAFRKIRLDPHLGAIVGDTEYDIIPAIRIGATSVVVSHGRKLSLSVKPDFTIDELPDLLRIQRDSF